MPAEIRHLVFSEVEAIIALRDYYRRSGNALPDRVVLRMTILGEDAPSVTLTAAAGRRRPAIDFRVSSEDLLSALILDCHNQGIPLPVRGSKELVVLNERLAIVVKLPRQANRARAA
jgi:hypothetical protein